MSTVSTLPPAVFAAWLDDLPRHDESRFPLRPAHLARVDVTHDLEESKQFLNSWSQAAGSPRVFVSGTSPKPSSSTPSRAENAPMAGGSPPPLPSAALSAKPIPSAEAAQNRPSAPRFAIQPGSARISSVSDAPSPPTSSGRPRIAAAIAAPPSSCSNRDQAYAARSSGRPKQTTPQPSGPVSTSAGS